MERKAKRRWLITGIVVGGLFTAAPVFGLLGTIIGMMRSFSVLGSSGVEDPEALSASIGTTLLSTAAGLFLLPIGIVLLTLSLIFYFRLEKTTPPALPLREN